MTTTRGDWRSVLARFGLSAKGVLYVALGLLAIQTAAGSASTESVSRRGAIELVAGQPFGQWLLGIFAVGLAALAIWQAILACTGDPVQGGETKDRLKSGGKAVIYGATAATAFAILLANLGTSAGGAISGAVGTAGAGGDATEQQAATVVMGWPGGPWMLALLGAAVLATAAYQLYAHAWNRKFMNRLNRRRMSAQLEAGVERAGRTGYAARSIVLAIVGTFFLVAAVRHDPQEAVGLSGTLRTLAQQTWGQAALWLVAVGLFLFGCFCFAEAKYRRAT